MDEQALREWLGSLPVINRARREELRAAAAAIAERYPRREQAGSREDALAGATAVLSGDTRVEELILIWRERDDAAKRAVLTGALVALGEGEDALVDRTRLPRATVRQALDLLHEHPPVAPVIRLSDWAAARGRGGAE